MLAIGGWNEGSSRFSPMVGSRERRKEFVRNAIKFLRQNRFDGLDLDWEYPAFRDGGKPKDRENYAKLVKELREEFDRESEKTGKPRLLLTMAVPAGIEYIQKGFDVKTLNRYLDWMNLLSYDYHSAFEPAVNHHAPLYPLEEPNEYSVDNELNIDYTIKFYIESGADPSKLVLGIPTYGRSYTLFNPDAVEIGSPADGPGEQGDATREKGYLAYYEICESLKPKEKKKKRQASDEDSEEYSDEEEEEEEWTVMHPNPEAMGPVAYRGSQWVGYDDVDIVRKKAEYVAENGLGGIMFWSIDNDDFRGTCHDKPYPLIEAAKESYFAKLGTSSGNVIKEKVSTSNRRKSRPRSSTTTTTTPKPSSKSNKRKPSSSVTSTTPAWNIITPEPPTTPDPGSDFKCVDEGFYPHPRDCKKYFWCLDSGPSNLGIVAHQFTCPSGLFFNKAADSCDFARNVLCKNKDPPAKAPTTRAPTTKAITTSTTTTTTTTRKPIRLSTKSSSLFRTTSTTTPEPEEEEYEDESREEPTDEDAEDPRVLKELIDLIKKVGGIEQLEKQLRFGENNQASTGGASTTTPSPFKKKLYQKVLERTRGQNRYTGPNSILENAGQNSRRGPQNAGIETSNDKDKLITKDRPQYTTINRQRGSKGTTEATPESEEIEDESQEEVQPILRPKSADTESRFGTTTKPLQYVNIRRARPTTSDTADDTASRNALFERSEPFVTVSDSPNSLDLLSARRENQPEYVTIRRQRPTTEETTTVQYNHNSEEEEELQETALEREISTQPQYTSIVRSRSTSRPAEEPSSEAPVLRVRSTTVATEETSSPDPTTVLSVQISSLLNSPNSAEIETTETESPAPTTVVETTTPTTTTTTTTTTPKPPGLPTRRTLIRRRGSTTPSPRTAATSPSTAAPSSITQAPNRSFLRRTKATAPPDTTETESSTDKTETTTNKFTRRGNSKFKSRKEAELEKKGATAKNEVENASRRPSFNGGARRSERPTRKFVRLRSGGANASTTTTSTATPLSTSSLSTIVTRRPFRVTSRRRIVPSTTTTTTTTTAAPTTTAVPTTAAPQAVTNAYEDEESLQDIGDIDAIEDPTLEPKVAKKNFKVQRRPLVNLKDDTKDQNPSATNEEENKRQSKKYSATIKQNQLNDLLKLKSQEETSTERKTTTADDFSAETALAIAAHQLITAPIPSIPDFEEDVKPTRKTQTTVEYKYTSREYNEYTDISRTPTYDEYQSTPIYRGIGSYDQTTSYKNPTDYDTTKIATGFDTTKIATDFDTTKIATDFDTTKIATDFDNTKEVTDFDTTNVATDFEAPKLPTTSAIYTNDYARATSNEPFTSEFDAPKISTTTYDVPKSTTFPNTVNTANTANLEFIRTNPNDYTINTSAYQLPEVTTTFSPRLPSTNYPNTVTNQEFVRTTFGGSYNTGSTFNSRNTYLPKATATNFPTNTVPSAFARTSANTYLETSTELVSKTSPTYVPKFPSTDFQNTINQEFGRTTLNSYDNTETEVNAHKISSTLAAPTPTRYFERTTFADTPTENSPRISSTFLPRSTATTKFSRSGSRFNKASTSAAPTEYTAIQRSSTPRFRTEKLIPVPVENTGYSTVSYTGPSQEPSYFTREYLLESPVTKTYDDEYQYLSPITTPQTPATAPPTRKIIRKKIQRRISTTLRPTEPPTSTTPVPRRRMPAKQPFEKIPKVPKKTYRPIANYDYYDDSDEKVAVKYVEGTKIVMRENGQIECLDIGNFPHPKSCKKFISCARIDNGSLLGWEYVCPKGLSFDPVGGICNWSAGLGCDEKDV